MARVLASLVEENRDFRKREVSILFIITNSTSKAVQVVSINPYIPDRVELIETRQFSLLSVKENHEILCAELNELANDLLIVESEGFRKDLINANREIFRSIFNEMTGWLGIGRLYMQVLTGKYFRSLEQAKKRGRAYKINIEGSKDAKAIYENFLEGNESRKSLTQMFGIKMEKLIECEASLGNGNDIKTSTIALIDAGEELTIRYLLRFPRRIFDSASFTVSVEAIYAYADLTQQYRIPTAQTISVPPNSISLSFVAIIAALLGVTLKHSVAWMNTSNTNLGIQFQPILAQAVAASVLAFIVFNVFEFTDMFKSLRQRLSWRQALFIGVLCGLGLDRIFEALGALVGVNISPS